MERSKRRGGEKSARFDFSTRREMSDDKDDCGTGFLTSSWVGLKNKARFDVSRVAVPNFGATGNNLLALFLSEPGVLRPSNTIIYIYYTERFKFLFEINYLEFVDFLTLVASEWWLSLSYPIFYKKKLN